MAQLALKGHLKRGREVIQLLEMLGGDNNYSRYCGYNTCTNTIYYIDSSDRNFIKMIENPSNISDFIVFTIEEFEEKFPYKVGDKVNSPCRGCIKTITSMHWDTYLNAITYKLDHRIYTNIDQLKVVNDLQSYKEETIEEKDEKTVKHVVNWTDFGI